MAKNPEALEAKMTVLGRTGRRVTMDLIKSHIDSIEYETVTINGQKMMFCGIKMDNGFVAVGKPATCIDPANWREEIGQQVSYDNSFEELWKLEAYRLMSEPSCRSRA
ncbi:Gp49 family protein [Klebsiella pasteurii]|uniref:Gp49 family protein n=1 Tax=Klebsiella pasteurii TaxID=2587529 RepID=UPI0035CFDC6C